jgi:hypothetical protein
VIDCRPQTEVVVRTSYADSSRYTFSKVFPPTFRIDDVFAGLLPIVLDCVNGVNGAILVSGGRCLPPPGPRRCVAVPNARRWSLSWCVAVALQAYGEKGLGKSSVMEGRNSEVGVIPRALNELFALRRLLGLAMSCCMFEVSGESVRDLLTSTALQAAKIDPRHVRASTVERHEVHEVLMYHRNHTLSLLHHALRNRASSSARETGKREAARRHFVTLVRVERPNQGKRGMLYLVDLAGTEDAVLGDHPDREVKAQFKTSVLTNSDLVGACAAVSLTLSPCHAVAVSPSCVCLCAYCSITWKEWFAAGRWGRSTFRPRALC